MLMTNVRVSGARYEWHRHRYIIFCRVSLRSFFSWYYSVAQFPTLSHHKLLWQDLPTCSSLNPGVLWLWLCLPCCSGGSCSCCICCRESCCSAQTCSRQLLSCEGGVGVTKVPAWKIKTLAPTISWHVSIHAQGQQQM